jgi:hypothetical protein
MSRQGSLGLSSLFPSPERNLQLVYVFYFKPEAVWCSTALWNFERAKKSIDTPSSKGWEKAAKVPFACIQLGCPFSPNDQHLRMAYNERTRIDERGRFPFGVSATSCASSSQIGQNRRKIMVPRCRSVRRQSFARAFVFYSARRKPIRHGCRVETWHIRRRVRAGTF